MVDKNPLNMVDLSSSFFVNVYQRLVSSECEAVESVAAISKKGGTPRKKNTMWGP